MALDTERSPTFAAGSEAILAGARRAAGTVALPLRYLRRKNPLRKQTKAGAAMARWWQAFPPVRFVSASLLRRVLVASLGGLVVMIGGILYFSENNGWLIDAKRESLRVQGEIIAAAIAGNARVETGRIVIHTDNMAMPDADDGGSGEDAFAAHELSIRPELVAVSYTHLRAHET